MSFFLLFTFTNTHVCILYMQDVKNSFVYLPSVYTFVQKYLVTSMQTFKILFKNSLCLLFFLVRIS